MTIYHNRYFAHVTPVHHFILYLLIYLSPFAFECWENSTNYIEILLTGESEYGYLFESALCNLLLVSFVTGFETYLKTRFIELYQEGLTLDIEALVKHFSKRDEIENDAEQLTSDDALINYINKKINFQNFKNINKAYGSCHVVNTIVYELGDNILLNKKDLWFTHYPQEHIQKIKHLFGLSSIPSEHKELFVRYEQQDHYKSNIQLRVGDSIESGTVELQNNGHYGTLNVVVELPTIRYIKVPIEDQVLWGHMTNLDLIRNSPFNQVGGYCTDEEFLELLNEFEQVVLDSVSSSEVAEAVKFIYVPHNPFIELKDGGWGISDQRTYL